jgi:hypothetical protein
MNQYIELTTKDLVLAAFIAVCTGHHVVFIVCCVLAGWSARNDWKKAKGS